MILFSCFLLTGCQQAQSFLHMNSDSPSPFFGLQLAVDRDSPSVEIPSSTSQPRNGENHSIQFPVTYLTKAQGTRNDQRLPPDLLDSSSKPNFSFTASQDLLQGNLKMALPKANPKSGSREADQLADLLHRLKQS